MNSDYVQNLLMGEGRHQMGLLPVYGRLFGHRLCPLKSVASVSPLPIRKVLILPAKGFLSFSVWS